MLETDGPRLLSVIRMNVFRLIYGYHLQVAVSELGADSAEVLAQLRYDLPASYAFHRYRQCALVDHHLQPRFCSLCQNISCQLLPTQL